MRWIWFASSASLVAISVGMLLTGVSGCSEVAVFGLIFLVEGLKTGSGDTEKA